MPPTEVGGAVTCLPLHGFQLAIPQGRSHPLGPEHGTAGGNRTRSVCATSRIFIRCACSLFRQLHTQFHMKIEPASVDGGLSPIGFCTPVHGFPSAILAGEGQTGRGSPPISVNLSYGRNELLLIPLSFKQLTSSPRLPPKVYLQ